MLPDGLRQSGSMNADGRLEWGSGDVWQRYSPDNALKVENDKDGAPSGSRGTNYVDGIWVSELDGSRSEIKGETLLVMGENNDVVLETRLDRSKVDTPLHCDVHYQLIAIVCN